HALQRNGAANIDNINISNYLGCPAPECHIRQGLSAADPAEGDPRPAFFFLGPHPGVCVANLGSGDSSVLTLESEDKNSLTTAVSSLVCGVTVTTSTCVFFYVCNFSRLDFVNFVSFFFFFFFFAPPFPCRGRVFPRAWMQSISLTELHNNPHLPYLRTHTYIHTYIHKLGGDSGSGKRMQKQKKKKKKKKKVTMTEARENKERKRWSCYRMMMTNLFVSRDIPYETRGGEKRLQNGIKTLIRQPTERDKKRASAISAERAGT
ncbi:hypothetical protein L249_2672, partial [Ophiocordyceps polyrhachis-furcata BCC 54312]